MYLFLIVQLDLVTWIYSETTWTVYKIMLPLYMEVPYESKLFVLIGLDINLSLLSWVSFSDFQPFWPNFWGVVLGMSRQSRQGLGNVSTTSQQRWSYYWSNQEFVRCLDANLGVSSKVVCLQSPTDPYRA